VGKGVGSARDSPSERLTKVPSLQPNAPFCPVSVRPTNVPVALTRAFGYRRHMRFLPYLTPAEMIAVSDQWTGPLKSAFTSIIEIAPLLDRVEEDRDALINARNSGAAESLLQAHNDQADSLDTQHDHLQRALHFGLRSAREALLGQTPPNAMLAAAIADAHEALLPSGLEIVNASYEGESGNAAQMVKLAQSQYADVLAKIPMAGNMSALDIVLEIGKVGAALGVTEQKKSVAAAVVENEAITPSEIKRRMRAWAGTVEVVLRTLERSKANANIIDQIRRPVEDAVEKARARRQAKQNVQSKKDADGGPSTPATPNTP
jgi:cytochrome c551/c552